MTEDELRGLILRLLNSKNSPPAIPSNMAMWWGVPVDQVREELKRLQADGIAKPLPTYRGRERIWVLAEP